MRYAISILPSAESELWRLGSAILGYDAVTGLDMPFPEHPLFHDPLSLAWSAEPRRFGLCGVLKAPFALADGCTEEQLRAELAAFAQKRRALTCDLTLAPVGHFLALVPEGAIPELQALAGDCVRHFDPFRAPMTAEDRERHHPDGLIERQVENLDTWGDAYVFDDFQFHLALTGDLDPADRRRVEPVLQHLLGAIPLQLAIDAVSLMVQTDPEGRFSAVDRFAFGS